MLDKEDLTWHQRMILYRMPTKFGHGLTIEEVEETMGVNPRSRERVAELNGDIHALMEKGVLKSYKAYSSPHEEHFYLSNEGQDLTHRLRSKRVTLIGGHPKREADAA